MASLPELTLADMYALLERRQCIAVIWSTDDVHFIRPDLNAEQCWEVLRDIDRHYDLHQGVSIHDLEFAAEELFGPAPADKSPSSLQ